MCTHRYFVAIDCALEGSALLVLGVEAHFRDVAGPNEAHYLSLMCKMTTRIPNADSVIPEFTPSMMEKPLGRAIYTYPLRQDCKGFSNTTAQGLPRSASFQFDPPAPDTVISSIYVRLPLEVTLKQGASALDIYKARALALSNFPERCIETLNIQSGGNLYSYKPKDYEYVLQQAFSQDRPGHAPDRNSFRPYGKGLDLNPGWRERERAVLKGVVATDSTKTELDVVLRLNGGVFQDRLFPWLHNGAVPYAEGVRIDLWFRQDQPKADHRTGVSASTQSGLCRHLFDFKTSFQRWRLTDSKTNQDAPGDKNEPTGVDIKFRQNMELVVEYTKIANMSPRYQLNRVDFEKHNSEWLKLSPDISKAGYLSKDVNHKFRLPALRFQEVPALIMLYAELDSSKMPWSAGDRTYFPRIRNLKVRLNSQEFALPYSLPSDLFYERFRRLTTSNITYEEWREEAPIVVLSPDMIGIQGDSFEESIERIGNLDIVCELEMTDRIGGVFAADAATALVENRFGYVETFHEEDNANGHKPLLSDRVYKTITCEARLSSAQNKYFPVMDSYRYHQQYVECVAGKEATDLPSILHFGDWLGFKSAEEGVTLKGADSKGYVYRQYLDLTRGGDGTLFIALEHGDVHNPILEFVVTETSSPPDNGAMIKLHMQIQARSRHKTVGSVSIKLVETVTKTDGVDQTNLPWELSGTTATSKDPHKRGVQEAGTIRFWKQPETKQVSATIIAPDAPHDHYCRVSAVFIYKNRAVVHTPEHSRIDEKLAFVSRVPAPSGLEMGPIPGTSW